MKVLLAKLVRFLILVAIGVVPAIGQTAISAATFRPFEPHEELYLEAEFSRSLLRNIDVADFKLSATRTPTGQTEKSKPYTLTFNADVSSKGFFARLFNIKFRERVESIVDPTSFKVQKTTILDESGKRVRHTETTFDNTKGKMTWTVRDPNNPTDEPRQSVTDFSGHIHDVLSAIYFIRTQPLQVGKSFEILIGDGGHIYKIPVRVLERKRMKTLIGRVNAFRVEPEIFGDDRLIDQEKGSFTLWITDDQRRLPVNTRVKTDYGTFEIKLKRVVTNPPR